MIRAQSKVAMLSATQALVASWCATSVLGDRSPLWRLLPVAVTVVWAATVALGVRVLLHGGDG